MPERPAVAATRPRRAATGGSPRQRQADLRADAAAGMRGRCGRGRDVAAGHVTDRHLAPDRAGHPRRASALAGPRGEHRRHVLVGAPFATVTVAQPVCPGAMDMCSGDTVTPVHVRGGGRAQECPGL
jgi:hypothetical protein